MGSFAKKFFIGIASLLVLVGFIGFILGYFLSSRTIHKEQKLCETLTPTPNLEAFYKEAVSKVSATSLNESLRNYSRIPRIAGSNESYQQALELQEQFKSYGFDAELKKYEILLSYPSEPGIVSLLGDNNTVLYQSAVQESILNPGENDSRAVTPYNAYSPSGDVTGKLVYANYGHENDFQYLKQQNISVKDKIVIVRYGNLFRGGKAQNAEKHGAKGLVIYSDPADYSPDGMNKTYPDYMGLSKDGVQRGNLWMEKGDPLTPGYPATDGIYRRPQSKAPFPKIPVKPISWEDALPLLKTLTKGNAPDAWQGGLGIQYNIEMGDADTSNVRVFVNNKLEKRPVYNVIASITGKEEPDRYVIVGCHRDAWVFGAVDPASGQTVMMEAARTIGEILKKGWRPRRTLMFASWDAEEFGVMGSAEWVEENEKILSTRAVAYINVDAAISGAHTFYAQSSPTLDLTLFEATKQVNAPSNTTKTLFEDWKTKSPDTTKNNPRVDVIGSGSDYLFFIQRIGIPCLSFGYKGKGSSYPVYHTMHDTYHWIKTFVDPEFRYHSAVTKVTLRTIFQLVDARLLPMNLTHLASALDKYGKALEKDNGAVLKAQTISLEYLTKAIKDFKTEAEKFMTSLKKVDTNSPLKLRSVNDRLMQLERAFINPDGLPKRPLMRNLIFAPSIFDIYKGSKFAGITDSIYEAKTNGDWDQVQQQISKVVHAIRSAVSILKT